MKKTSISVRSLVLSAALSAVAFVLYLFEIPMINVGFLKFDLSDLPALIGGTILGPSYAILIAFLKNLLHIPVSKDVIPWVGEFANFSYALLFCLPFILIKDKSDQLINKIIASVVAVVIATAGMMVINYYITFPLYGYTDQKAVLSMLVSMFIPFNLIKGALLSFVYFLLERPLHRLILRKTARNATSG